MDSNCTWTRCLLPMIPSYIGLLGGPCFPGCVKMVQMPNTQSISMMSTINIPLNTWFMCLRIPHIQNANCACAKMLYYIYVYQHDKYWKILDKQNEKKGGSSVLTFNQSMLLQHCWSEILHPTQISKYAFTINS